ncbi:hypothetical protein [Kordiimonas lacus]|nr:hypothetical protein [Kordiimonas lacus]
MSHLKVNRLVVLRDVDSRSIKVFDEQFHDGLNIIRSKGNSSGKTTVVDFIYFALGGEHTNWKSIALECSRVILEIQANGTPLTLRRTVSTEDQLPIDIYYGPYEEAIKHANGWTSHAYSRQQRALSFSEVLFKALGIPEAPSSLNTKMTMYQLLRLLYSDQFADSLHIYRSDDWSSKDTQQAIGELLCGVGDFELFAKKTELKEVQAKVGDLKSSYRSLSKLLASFSDNAKIDIEAVISTVRQKLRSSESELDEAQSSYDLAHDQEVRKDKSRLQSALITHQKRLVKAEEDLKILSYENEERSRFIVHLEGLLEDFDDANEVFDALGHIRYTHCPSCFKDLPPQQPEACSVCGAPLEAGDQNPLALAARLDLEMQIRESQKMEEKAKSDIAKAKEKLRKEQKECKKVERDLAKFRNSLTSPQATFVASKAKEVGALEAHLDELENIKLQFGELATIENDLEEAERRFRKLTRDVENIEVSLTKRRSKIYTDISANTIDIIGKDLKDHNDFEGLRSFSFSFRDDSFYLNNMEKVTNSASSMAIAKVSFLLAIFKASLEDNEMYFPRFMILDNIEDKGVREVRSQNFQNIVAEISENSDVDHQIIITTATISPELDNPKYTVGELYSTENRSIKLEGLTVQTVHGRDVH